MNALVRSPVALDPAYRVGDAETLDLPPDAPLAMPAQSLRTAATPGATPAWTRASLRLGGLIMATLIMTGLALTPVWRVLAADTIGPLDVVILTLVALLFA